MVHNLECRFCVLVGRLVFCAYHGSYLDRCGSLLGGLLFPCGFLQVLQTPWVHLQKSTPVATAAGRMHSAMAPQVVGAAHGMMEAWEAESDGVVLVVVPVLWAG